MGQIPKNLYSIPDLRFPLHSIHYLFFLKYTGHNCLVLQENIRLGQRVSAFRAFAFENGDWKPLVAGTTIGYKRILRLDGEHEAQKIKIEIDGKAALCISNIAVYKTGK